MLVSLVPTLIEAALGGTRGFLVGVGLSVLQSALPLLLKQIGAAGAGDRTTTPAPRCHACARRCAPRHDPPRAARAGLVRPARPGARPVRRPRAPGRTR